MTHTSPRWRTASALLLALMAVSLTGAPQAQAFQPQTFQLVARHSGKCLDVAWASQADRAPIVQGTCSGERNQHWLSYQPWYGWEMLVAEHSGKCLDVPNGSKDDGAGVIQYTCWGGNNQRWNIQDLGNGYNRIVNLHSNKCLDVAWASQLHAAPVVQSVCTAPNLNQQWRKVEL